jgi:FtsP/CotA-like multicopper oxidase with cupredoxin domain
MVMKNIGFAALLLTGLMTLFAGQALADGGVCPRPAAGIDLPPPPDLYSQNGVLNVSMGYHTSVDDAGRTLFCFVTSDGLESPTLHVNPGDTINITLTNMLTDEPGGRSEVISNAKDVCGAATMMTTSVNMHFHGTNTAPTCHSDETIRTLVNPGETFNYVLHIPKDEPPGLYWYHPHVHGISSAAVQGGATGAIEVEGIANVQPAVAGLPERFIVLRDQQFAEFPISTNAPFWDVSVNYVPVSYPYYPPAITKMQAGSKEFWRVVNASANTIMDLQVTYDGVVQPLQVVAFDGVPTGSKDGKDKGTIVTRNDVLVPPAGRVEFILAAPTSSSVNAVFKTLNIEGGPSADVNPERPLIKIVTTSAPSKLPRMAAPTGAPRKMRFDDLANAKITARRNLYFSEYAQIHIQKKPGQREFHPSRFFITVKGADETLFDPNNPPAITTTKGAVEEWTIENHTDEVHEFHIHQIHFLVQEISGVKIPRDQQQLYDTFQVPYWDDDPNHPYPYIKVKMDFRGPTIGDFLYHCHILDHEDAGMMAIIRVQAPGHAKSAVSKQAAAKSKRVRFAAAQVDQDGL